MRQLIIILAGLLASPALAQMTPEQMTAMGIGPAIQHGPPGPPITSVPVYHPPYHLCLEAVDGKETCTVVEECRPNGPRPCRASADNPMVRP